jgi:predicted phosphoribosyltransferase
MDGFRDRTEAGRLLAAKLAEYGEREDVLVLGLPRGGVPVAFEVAGALAAPLDLLMVRKLGVPGHEELALGAIASGGVRVLNASLVQALALPTNRIDSITAKERRALERRERDYRGDHPQPELAGRIVILVDDGLATGATMLAAIRSARAQHAARVVVAVPVAPRETCDALRRDADVVACLITPANFRAVSAWYDDFSATTDAEVRRLLSSPRSA